MRHMGLGTIGIAAVASAILALSGTAWAQQAPKGSASGSAPKAESASTSTANCVRTKGGDCIKLKSGSELVIKESSKTK